jgi:tRNA-2-methylthio-N6-dimethylallyladenosine synthase
MVEGKNAARGQMSGRTSQNKTLNFVIREGSTEPAIGEYIPVRVTQAFPNSLLGEFAEWSRGEEEPQFPL